MSESGIGEVMARVIADRDRLAAENNKCRTLHDQLATNLAMVAAALTETEQDRDRLAAEVERLRSQVDEKERDRRAMALVHTGNLDDDRMIAQHRALLVMARRAAVLVGLGDEATPAEVLARIEVAAAEVERLRGLLREALPTIRQATKWCVHRHSFISALDSEDLSKIAAACGEVGK